ncbi:autotransporter outer membrane beta-barrel domain-containing protein [Pseudomonas abietaniphila]
MNTKRNLVVHAYEGILGLVIVMLVSNGAKGAVLGAGQTATVVAGAPAERWSMQAATLNVLPGGVTLGVSALNRSILNFSGAATTGGVSITGGTGTFLDSTITSATGIGLNAAALGSFTGAGSTVQVTNGVISGFGRGINVSTESNATLTSTQVTGSGVGATVADNGYGAVVIGSTLTVQEGSAITGSNRGAFVVDNGADFPNTALVVDNSTITGVEGSGIFANSVRGISTSTVTLRNGAVVNSGNGQLLQVGESATASPFLTTVNLLVENSALTGDISVFGGNVANVALTNDSSLTGNMTDISRLDLNASRVTGNLDVAAGSTVPVTLSGGASYTGTMSNIGSLSMDNSAMTGNVIQASGSVATVALANGSTLTGSLNNVGSVSLDNSEITGDITQDAGTPGAISLVNNARMTGTITNAQNTTLEGTSTFNMINDSSVGNLALNGGTVNLRAANSGFRTLTASSLTGAGTFVMGTDLAGHLSDLVNITGNASGNHTLAVQNTGVDPIEETHAQQVVHTGSGDAVFAVAGGQVDVGTFVFRLEQRNTDWYLVQATTGGGENPGGGGENPGGGGENPGGGGENPGGGGESPGGGGPPVISPSARAVIGVFSAAPTVWYGEMSSLRSRMGELRNGHEAGGFWARTYGNRYRVSATDQVDYTQNQSGISFGVDTPVSNQDGQWLLGVIGGYSNSDLNLRRGTDGQVDSYYLGLYSTWVSPSGYYIDAVIKANRFHNKTDVRMSDGVKAEGDYDNYGVGGSVEVGKNIKLGDGWFIEPYTQVSALWVEGDNYGLDNGLEAKSNHADSFIGKVGTYVGRTIALDRGGFVQPYVKVAAAQEFARSNKVKVNNTTFSDDLSGSRGEVGTGVVAQLTDVFQVHADLDYGTGQNIEQPWGVNIGLRYAW